MNSSSLYIDLGTSNTSIYKKNAGLLFKEPSVVAYRLASENRTVIAAGVQAKRMIGKTPEGLEVGRPLREGVIADFLTTTNMLSYFLSRVKRSSYLGKPTILISLPSHASNFEAEAVRSTAKEIGAGQIHLLDEPMAAAIGSGVNVMGRAASMIVDIGGGTTEVAIISCGGIVQSEAIRIGGNNLDLAIMDYIRSHLNFLIGEQTAELLKISIGAAYTHGQEDVEFEVGGLDLEKGLPGRRKISRTFLFPVINGFVKQILRATHQVLQKVSPEIASDLVDAGIILSGGGALLHGLAARFENEFGVKTMISKNPNTAVSTGGAMVLENPSLLEKITKDR